MKRQWYETLDERKHQMRENIMKAKEPTKRRPYRWGAKEYLAGFNVGETKIYQDQFRWRSLQEIASRLKMGFGSIFRFDTIEKVKYITRIR